MNWQYFSILGYFGVALWLAAALLWLVYWYRQQPRLRYIATAMTLAAFVCAKVNSATHVNRIEAIPANVLTQSASREEEIRKAALEVRGSEVAQITFAEDASGEFLDKAGMNEADLKYLGGGEPSATPEWKRQKQGRSNDAGEDASPEDKLSSEISGPDTSKGMDAGIVGESGERPLITMSEADVAKAHRLDRWNLGATRFLILAAVLLLTVDYLRRANKYALASFPLPLGGVAAAIFGLVFGLAAVRIKGFYLALTTIAAQILFHFLVLNLPSNWLGGANGLTLEPARLFGYVLDSDRSIYYLCLVVACVMIAGAYGVARSRHGRAFFAVRDDDVASGMMGIDVVRTKAMAFLLGAFYAGIGGGLWAYYVRFVAIDQFTLIHSIWFIAMIIVGGMGSITGALIGVFLIRLSQETISSMGPKLIEHFSFLTGDVVFAAMNIFLGGVISGFLIFEPRGLMHRWTILKRSYRLWPYSY